MFNPSVFDHIRVFWHKMLLCSACLFLTLQLELALTLKNPRSLQWRMAFGKHNLGARALHCCWVSLVLDISGDRASTELFKIKQQFIQIFPTFWIQMFAWFLWFYTYMLLSSTKVFVLNNIMWLFCVTWKYTYDSKNSICITANRLLNLSRYVYSFYMFLEYLPLWKSADVHVTYYVLHVCVCVCVLVAQSCPTVCYLLDYSPPGSSVHGILQARVLVWGVISFSRGPFPPSVQTQVS